MEKLAGMPLNTDPVARLGDFSGVLRVPPEKDILSEGTIVSPLGH